MIGEGIQYVSMDEFYADVLVIGGGLAGVVAAISAAMAGKDVAILSRGRIGRSGNTVVSGSAMAVYRGDNPYQDSIPDFRQDVLSSGKGLSDRGMADRFVRESEPVFDLLESYGVKFRYVEGNRLIKQPPGHSHRRSYPTDFRTCPYLNRGLAFGLPLREKALETGVRFYEGCDALSLDAVEGQICGVYALDVHSQKLFYFHSAAVILSCGGGASIYWNTNNTSDVTCDSYRLASEAGAVLRDMEFVQFYPTMMFEPARVVISNPLFGDGAVVRNRYGERFLSRYTPMGDRATRDNMSRAIQLEIQAGGGNPDYVYVDCSMIDPRTLDMKYAELSEQLRRHGLDIHSDLIPVAPTAHFYLGGICVNESCATSVSGLYACGEAVGGLHGANRLSGNALTEAAVSGRIAGEGAAKDLPSLNTRRVLHMLAMPKGRNDEDAGALIQRLRKVMWQKASIVKTEASLSDASAEIDMIERKSRDCVVRSAADLRRFYQLRSYLSTARMLLICSKQRKESRGAFYREDYPNTNAQWAGSFFCSIQNGELLTKFVYNDRKE